MKSSQMALLWGAFFICALLILGAMSWLTRGVILSNQTSQLAEARANLEERTRLALWRMDALGARILQEHNQLNPNEFRQFCPSQSEADPMHFFEWNETSKSLVHGDSKPIREILRHHPNLFSKAQEALSKNKSPIAPSLSQDFKEMPLRQVEGLDEKQVQSNFQELNKRATTLKSALPSPNQAQRTSPISKETLQSPSASPSPSREASDSFDPPEEYSIMEALWVDQELFLLRKVRGSRPNATTFQGIWLKAHALQERFLSEIRDLLPHAELCPLWQPSPHPNPLTLVTFPFSLERHESPQAHDAHPWFGSNAMPLWLAWLALLLALSAGFFLIWSLIQLSERRASFVSAVTHELRTPLTTFCLYSDMLEQGAVKPEKQPQYLRVLSREADRLNHLVENVLAFSRLERGSARSHTQVIRLSELVTRSQERFESRLASAHLQLKLNFQNDALVLADLNAVEHILFNLIDNAAKYANPTRSPEVLIKGETHGNYGILLLSDSGPGIPLGESARIFKAFHKSANQAAESQPGVGLGLALSRRLARSQGGDLTLIPNTEGTCFALKLPLHSSQSRA